MDGGETEEGRENMWLQSQHSGSMLVMQLWASRLNLPGLRPLAYKTTAERLDL